MMTVVRSEEKSTEGEGGPLITVTQGCFRNKVNGMQFRFQSSHKSHTSGINTPTLTEGGGPCERVVSKTL